MKSLIILFCGCQIFTEKESLAFSELIYSGESVSAEKLSDFPAEIFFGKDDAEAADILFALKRERSFSLSGTENLFSDENIRELREFLKILPDCRCSRIYIQIKKNDSMFQKTVIYRTRIILEKMEKNLRIRFFETGLRINFENPYSPNAWLKRYSVKEECSSNDKMLHFPSESEKIEILQDNEFKCGKNSFLFRKREMKKKPKETPKSLKDKLKEIENLFNEGLISLEERNSLRRKLLQNRYGTE
ncbi:MAG TPA: hypothetical protein PKV80_18575 [Leptospiraceae bacterium]|nr:hypothetical protein [Leptospiraceae bacterium]